MRTLWIFLFIHISIAYGAHPKLTDPILTNHKQVVNHIALYASKINPKLSHTQTLYLAYHIVHKSLQRELDPYKVAAIIGLESSFKVDAYNITGDYSLAQINYRIWSKEFPRLGLGPLNKFLLKNDPVYAITKMTKILKVLKTRYSNDPKWYLRYHSSTGKYKKIYEKKLKKQLLVLTNVKGDVKIANNEPFGGQ